MIVRWLAAGLFLLSGPSTGAGGWAQGSDPGRLEAFVPRMENARAQLDHARRLKRSFQGKEAKERDFWCKLAVEAYLAVRTFHPEAHALSAEAAFRAGEILRAAQREEEALAEFRAAHTLGADTPFRARARLEMGHIQRRRGAASMALSAYLDVIADPKSEPAQRDDAWLWAGRVWKDRGQLDEARRAWRSVVARGADPIDRIQAFDYLGLLWLEEKDLEAAAGVLDECMRELAESALEETRSGDRARKALQRMRLLDALPRAIELRKRSRPAEGTPRKP